MFTNTAALLTVALAAIATAVPTYLPRGGGEDVGGGNCNANALCCDNVGSVRVPVQVAPPTLPHYEICSTRPQA